MNNTTIAAIRASAGTLTDNVFYVSDPDQAGIWSYDPDDLSSADDTGYVLVNRDGKRFKFHNDGNDLNVRRFGANGNGTADNTLCFENAAKAAIALGVGIYIPKSAAYYHISATVRIRMAANTNSTFRMTSDGAVIKPNRVLSINQTIFNLTQNREWVFISIGPDSVYPLPQDKITNAFENNYGCRVIIQGQLTFDASAFPLVRMPENYQVDIAIPLQISAETVTLEQVTIKNVIGYGCRIMGPKTLNITNADFDKVGYRDKYGTNTSNDNYRGNDSYGDCIHIMATKENAVLTFDAVNIKGIRDGWRTRVGITLEYAEKRARSSKVKIENSSMQNVAKCLHIENAEHYQVAVSNTTFFDFNTLLANAVNSPVYRFFSCKIGITDLDGNERLGGIPALDVDVNALPDISFDSCDFDFNCAAGGRMLLGNVSEFQRCNFYGREKEAKFYDGAGDVVFDNCSFYDMGTLSTSGAIFSGWSEKSKSYQLNNCRFSAGRELTIASDNQYITAVNAVHQAKSQSILTNKVQLIGGLLPYDSLVMYRRLDYPGTQLVLDRVNMPSPLWDMQKFSFFVISGNQKNSTRGFTILEWLKAEGYFMGDAVMIPAGYHMFTNTKYGNEPSGYAISTTNGGVTWVKPTGTNVTDLYVVFFPSHLKSFLI